MFFYLSISFEIVSFFETRKTLNLHFWPHLETIFRQIANCYRFFFFFLFRLYHVIFQSISPFIFKSSGNIYESNDTSKNYIKIEGFEKARITASNLKNRSAYMAFMCIILRYFRVEFLKNRGDLRDANNGNISYILHLL